MRQEFENHGSETLQSDKMTFVELARKYETTKLVQAVYVDGVKFAEDVPLNPLKLLSIPFQHILGAKTFVL